MLTFKCAGDLGDILFTLPVVRHMGGGTYLIEAATYTRQMLTPDKWCGIDQLLRQQHYIKDVREAKHNEHCSVNLNDFRARLFKSLRMGQGKDKALVDWMLDAHNVPREAKNEAWLKVEPNPIAKVVFNRTGPGRVRGLTYHNPAFPWHAVGRKYGKDAVFIGGHDEYNVFRQVCWDVPYFPTPTLLDAARVIAGAQLFIGNQSACHAIAEGLKQNIILEVWPEGPNCIHVRDGVTHGWNQDVELPDL